MSEGIVEDVSTDLYIFNMNLYIFTLPEYAASSSISNFFISTAASITVGHVNVLCVSEAPLRARR